MTAFTPRRIVIVLPNDLYEALVQASIEEDRPMFRIVREALRESLG